MALDELAITMGNIGTGEWKLEVEDGETYEVFLDELEVDEQQGFHAEGQDEERGLLVELTTGKQPGGTIRLRKRALEADEWETVGEVAEATKVG